MLPGNKYVNTETGILAMPPSGDLSVAPPEGRLYLSRRFLAYFLDLLVQYIVSLGASLGVMVILMITLDWSGYPTSLVSGGLDPGGLLFSVILYSAVIRFKLICEGLCGQTVGKKMTGLIVVMEDGKPCTMRAAIIRSIATFVDSLFWGLVAFIKMQSTPWKRRCGDVWAKTVVICSRQADGQRERGRIPFFASLFIALLIECILASLIFVLEILSNPVG